VSGRADGAGSPPVARRILIAGIGNVLRMDDGFGMAVAEALESRPELPTGVRVVEIGIGGIGLVHELMDGYDALILLDAVDRGGEPGSLYVLDPDVSAPAAMGADERRIVASDLHQLVPARSLAAAAALGVLPPVVRIVGCQPGETDVLSTEFTAPVRAALPRAVEMVLRLANELAGGRTTGAAADGVIQRRDELLQVMYWMRGEGLGEEVGAADVARLLPDTPLEVLADDLRRLCDAGLAVPAGEGRVRLSEAGTREGARRFAEEFADYTRPGHGACSDPECDCHTLGPEACVHAG
jgi:hydrogenase maturation protease